MKSLGVIRADRDPPGISNERWRTLIREHPNLVAAEPRRSINPFTRKPMTIRPRPDVARVVVENHEVGTMSWCESGENEINVFGDPQSMIPVACEIAELLGGRFDAGEV
jgi:hypothetical protein